MVENKYYIENDPNKPLAEQAADKISEFILDHKLLEGDKLPSEFELAKLINVGRSTIREAIKLLISKNIVEIRRGAGTFVREQCGVATDPLGLSFVQDKEKLSTDTLQLRLIIEPQMAAFAAKNATKQQIEQLEEICDELMRREMFSLEVEEERKRFHLQLAKCSHNIAMEHMLPVLYEEPKKKGQLQLYKKLVGELKSQEERRAYEIMELIMLQFMYE